MPWHVYVRLEYHERAEVIAHFREHQMREGYRAQKVKKKEDPHAEIRSAYFGG